MESKAPAERPPSHPRILFKSGTAVEGLEEFPGSHRGRHQRRERGDILQRIPALRAASSPGKGNVPTPDLLTELSLLFENRLLLLLLLLLLLSAFFILFPI